MKNYRELMRRIAFWLQPEGKLFVQLGTHRELVGNFTDNDSSNAMIRYFFPSGTMPSHDLLLYFQDDLVIERDWKIPGTHCSRTAEAWLGMMEVNRQRISLILEKACGREHAAEWRARWRTFLMNCSEFWGYRRGEEWMISHYLFGK
jgi:cyclopropane-fatty-acyl-phospholipid synthase